MLATRASRSTSPLVSALAVITILALAAIVLEVDDFPIPKPTYEVTR